MPTVKYLEKSNIKESFIEMPRKIKRKLNYDQELARKISINNLILIGIHSMAINKKECTFELLLKECFTLFPKIFSLSQYQKWPDARKLDRPLRTLRKKNLIKGNPKTHFSLTKIGRKRASEITRAFRQGKLL